MAESEKLKQSLEGVSETLLMTLYLRARESRRPDAMIMDERAVAMIERIDCDFSRFQMRRHDEIALLMRMTRFDDHVRDFLKRNPEAVVVHVGCGLDTRFERVDNGQVLWFDLDLPDVMALRQKLIQGDSSRHHALATSVFEDGWIEEVSRYKPSTFMFIAEGVLAYFEEAQVKALFLKLCEHFPGCELVCEAQTPFGMWADNMHLAYAKVKARLHWSLNSGKEVECWGAASSTGAGIRLLDEWYYYDEAESPLKAYRWMRLIPPIAKASGIFHYRLGEKRTPLEANFRGVP
jgi:O-methyltransferase involved in polyketide biosynthesis